MSVRGQAGCVHKPPAVSAESKRANQPHGLAVDDDDDNDDDYGGGVVYGI